MTVLITGAGGMLARYLAKALSANHEVVALTRADYDVVSDILPDRVPRRRFDYIVNCAAYTNVDRAEQDYDNATSVNALGAQNLALRARAWNATLVTYSTDFIFAGDSSAPYRVTSEAKPLSAYGRSKWLGECMVRETGCRHLIIRTAWLFGKGKRNFISAVLERARGLSEIDVVSDQTGCPTYAHDLARATRDLMSAGALGTFHVTNAGCCTRAELAGEAIRLARLQCRVVGVETCLAPGVAPRPAYSVLDPAPLEQTLGYCMPGWRDAVTRYLAEEGWLKE